MSKNSFVIMDSWAKTLLNAPKEQAGELIQLLCRYNATGDDSCDDPMISAVFAGWKEQMDANNATYEKTCKQRSDAGKKGMAKRWGEDNKVITNDNKSITKHNGVITNDNTDITGDNKGITKITDTDTDNDNKYISPNGDIVGQARPNESDIDEIIDYLNTATQSKFSKKTAATRKAIIARLKEYSVDDFKKVIDAKVREWGDDPEMRQYLRPQTLFRPSNFEAYLNEANRPRPSNKKFNGIQNNKYDFDELEKQLISN